MRMSNRFAKHVQRFVRQRSFQFGKNNVLFQVDMTREVFDECREVHAELRIGRSRTVQRVKRQEKIRAHVTRLGRTFFAP